MVVFRSVVEMVFFFDVGEDTAAGRAGYTVYMGKDSAENDALIEYGWRSDVWFHVDSLSSAHVYLRLPAETALCGCEQRCGCLLELVSEEIIDEMCQLVKANSISGVKMASVQVVYTPHSNLRKEADMKEGSVSFYSSSHRRLKLVEKNRELVKRLEKTRREAFPDLQRERMVFRQQCVGILKARRQAAAKAAAEADPRKKQYAKAKEHEQFLASGGYHSGAIAAQEADQAQADALWNDLEGPVADGDTLVMGGEGDGAVEGEPEPAGEADAESESEAEEPQRTYAEEEQLRQKESDHDLRWLRERGYEEEKARSALQAQGSAASAFVRRLAALSALQPREVSEDVDADASAASEGREEEREALESILGEDVLVQIEAGDGESEHIGVPIQGFEPPDGASALVVEIYIDAETAVCGYPLGRALPLMAVVGGGLLEEELRILTTGLIAHAQENIEVGPIAFELTSYAEEQATELVEQREKRAKALAQRRAAAKRRAEGKANPPKAAAAPQAPAKPSASSEAARKARRQDAQSRLGKFGEGKIASTFVTVNEVPTEAADVLGGGGIDKGGYVSKKKKKKK
eukprot:COSAG02_NODE_378_length_23535_cov_35.310164_12_plen_578_part_00